MRSHSKLLMAFAFPAHRESASGVTKNLRGPAGFIGGGNPLSRPPVSALRGNGSTPLLLRAKVGILVHHVDECALDQVGEFERTAECAVTLYTLLDIAGNLDAQKSAFLWGFELENGHGVSFVDGVEESSAPTLARQLSGRNSQNCQVLQAGRPGANGIETILNRAANAATGGKEGAALPLPRATSEQTSLGE